MKAEKIYYEEGGWSCGKCGWYHDDYYDIKEINWCPKCGAILRDTNKWIDRYYRLSENSRFFDESEYPEWLLKLRKNDGGKDGES